MNNVQNAVTAIIASANAAVTHEKEGAKLSQAISTLYAESAGSEAEFFTVFGNGRPPKAGDFIAGSLAEGVRAKAAKLAKEKQDSVLGILKARLSEARRLFKAGGMPAKSESIREALKRYAAPKAPKPEGNEGKFEIPEEISADALADALSLWLAKQTPAKQAALAKDLKDFMPAATPVKRKAA